MSFFKKGNGSGGLITENDLPSTVKTKLGQIPEITSRLADTAIQANKVLNVLPIYKNNVHSNLQHLFNPFVKSQIKLLGDSITAGASGTGYSPTGEVIFGSYKANVPTAKCWANDFVEFINDNFNKTVDVTVDNPGLTIKGTKTVLESWGPLGKAYQFAGNGVNTNGIEFTFYGTEFTLLYSKATNLGIMNLYVDDVLKAEVDGYSSTGVSTELKITGLSEGTHTVKLMDTNTKNDSSSNKLSIIEGFKIPKKAVCKNWGISGVNSKFIYDNLSKLSTTDDTTVILQIGTNDRGNFGSPQYTLYNYKRIQDVLTASNKNLIMMVANATTDEATGKRFRMSDLDNAMQQYCIDSKVEYVSNYKAFINYRNVYNANLTTLLDSQGLHPNDRGYNLMYSNIIYSLGL